VDWTSRCVHSSAVLLISGESGLTPGMLKRGAPLLSVLGSGQFGTPWDRMHRAKFTMPLIICGTWAWVGWSRCAQALWATWNWELLTPICCGVTLGTPPVRVGSGKAGTPCERTQWEKATALELGAWELTGPPAFGEPPEPVDDGLPPHAAASRARAAVAAMAAAIRAAGGRARRGRRMTRVLGLPGGCHSPRPGEAPRAVAPPGSRHRVGFMPAIHTPGQVTSALHAMLHGCHPGRRMMGGCGCWWSRTMRRWPGGSFRG
jgi:hypothetical protein